MILEKYIEVNITSSNKQHFINLNYEITNKLILVDVNHLSKGSKTIITAICDICNKHKQIPYKSYHNSFSNGGIYTCSSKCSRIKFKNTCIEKYGVDNPSYNEETIKKRKETYSIISKNIKELKTQNEKEFNIQTYGIENPTKKEKTEITNIKKYGVKHVLQLDYIREKGSNTYFEKYGVKHNSQNKEVNQQKTIKKKNTYNLKTVKKYTNLIGNKFEILSYTDKTFKIKDLRNDTYFYIPISILRDRLKWNNTEISTIINPINNKCVSGLELKLRQWLETLNIKMEFNTKNLIPPYEIDIYLPDFNLAIEFNGFYWHSDKFVNKDYYFNKTIKCKNKGIELIHIFENDWINNEDIIKSIILKKLNLITKTINFKDLTCDFEFNSSDFIRTNSIKKVKLYNNLNFNYKNKVICVLNYIVVDNKLIIYEICENIHYKIKNIINELMNYIHNNFKINKIFYYADNNFSEETPYINEGFIYHKTIENWFEYKNNKIWDSGFNLLVKINKIE